MRAATQGDGQQKDICTTASLGILQRLLSKIPTEKLPAPMAEHLAKLVVDPEVQKAAELLEKEAAFVERPAEDVDMSARPLPVVARLPPPALSVTPRRSRSPAPSTKDKSLINIGEGMELLQLLRDCPPDHVGMLLDNKRDHLILLADWCAWQVESEAKRQRLGL